MEEEVRIVRSCVASGNLAPARALPPITYQVRTNRRQRLSSPTQTSVIQTYSGGIMARFSTRRKSPKDIRVRSLTNAYS